MGNTSSSKKENFFFKPSYKKNDILHKFVFTICTVIITCICFCYGKYIYEWYVSLRMLEPKSVFISILVGYFVHSLKTWIKIHNENYISKCKEEEEEKKSFSQLFITYCINYPLVLFFSYLSLWYLLPAFKSSSPLKTLHFVILGLIIGYLSDAIWNKRNSL